MRPFSCQVPKAAFFICLVFAYLATPSCITAPGPRIISASDPRITYEGRFDFSNTNEPVVIWQASRIRFDFSGDTVSVDFAGARGQNFFNAQVDASNTVVEVKAGESSLKVTLSGYGPGRHHLALFKRTEATAGTVRFTGIELPGSAKIWPSSRNYKVKMEFIGDSITVGACNEDGAKDQWETRRTHNAAESYAALIASAFSADHRNIAVSGMGVAVGWASVKAGEVWNRIYPEPASELANTKEWMPQVVFVNFGENDDSFSRAHGQPFPTNDYAGGYVTLIQSIRSAYPAAEIVILRGGMAGGGTSEPLAAAWGSAVQQAEAGDYHVHHFIFKHWTHTHPRVADDRIMADELIAWLKQQDFMRRVPP